MTEVTKAFKAHPRCRQCDLYHAKTRSCTLRTQPIYVKAEWVACQMFTDKENRNV